MSQAHRATLRQGGRSVGIGGDAVGNFIIPGDRNVVIVEAARPTTEQPAAAAEAELHDHLTGAGAALAKFLDHQEQLLRIRELFAASAEDRLIGLVECCAEDWPKDLADHIQSAYEPDPARTLLSAAIELNLNRRTDARAVWEALVSAVPNAATLGNLDAKRAAVRDLLGAQGLTVVYVQVNLRHYAPYLVEIIRGAHEDLMALGDVGPKARLLVLSAAIRTDMRSPALWRWLHVKRLRWLGCCHELTPLRSLEKADIADWHNAFPPALRRCLDRDRLCAELLELFGSGDAVRHHQARCLLVGCQSDAGALSRAHIAPCGPRPG